METLEESRFVPQSDEGNKHKLLDFNVVCQNLIASNHCGT